MMNVDYFQRPWGFIVGKITKLLANHSRNTKLLANHSRNRSDLSIPSNKSVTFSLNRPHFFAKGAICIVPFFIVNFLFTPFFSLCYEQTSTAAITIILMVRLSCSETTA